MKKAVLALCLVFLLGISVSAAETDHPHAQDHCVCGGSSVEVHDHGCETISWKPLPAGTTDLSKLADGNYYLTGDVTVTAASHWEAQQNISLCLNGYDIGTSTGAVFGYLKAGAVLNICDCSGTQAADGSWSWGGTVSGNQAGKSRSYGGIFNLNANAVANIYGGNYVGADSAVSGGAFNVCNDSFAFAGVTSNSDASLFTKLTIYNGHIRGGTVSNQGGAINTWHTADVAIYGGTVTGGSAKNGGNIFFNLGDLVLKNCTVSHGSATGSYGNIYIHKNAASVTVENTTVSGGTAGSSYGNIYIKSDVLDLSKNTVSGGQPEVARVVRSGKYLVGQYNDLQDTIDAAQDQPDLSVQLLQDTDQAAQVTGTLLLDLAGHDLSGILITGTLYGMDSTTKGYDDSQAGTLTPASGAPQVHIKTTEEQIGGIYRYLAVENNGTYSFHRFYIGITKISLKPSSVGMGYKATFAGDDTVKAALDVIQGYGYSLWLEGGTPVKRGYPGAKFETTQELTLRIENFLSTGNTDEVNAQRAEMDVHATAFLRLSDGTVITSSKVSYNFHEMVQLADDAFDTYTASQQKALQTLGGSFSQTMLTWDVSHIHHASGSIWEAVDTESFLAKLTKSGSRYLLPSGCYVLTEDVDLGGKTLRIDEGASVSLCLNGYTLTDSVRGFNQYGELNICDCHHHGQEGSIVGAQAADADTKRYAPVLYAYYNSVTNLYGGDLTATGTVTHGGVVAVSHDGDYEDETQVPAVFNMYGGTISGGTVTGNGGNVILWNNGVFNLYDGKISGGSATNGGGIYVNSGCVNIYGGTVADNVANGGNGGNIWNAGSLQLQGGTVTGGEATESVVDGVTQLDTGLGGGIYTKKDVTAGENVNITGNTGSDLYLPQLIKVHAQDLRPTAKISVYPEIQGQITSDAALADCFTTTKAGFRIAAVNGGVALIPEDTDAEAVTGLDDTFRVGYSMVNITPEEEGLKMSSFGNPEGRLTSGVNYELFVTAIAVTDVENNSFLMITMDIQNTPEDILEPVRTRISQVTGIPADNIYLSATHTHNAPSITTSTGGNTRYRTLLIDRLVQSAVQAMADRSAATMQTGSFETQGMNFTRHYYYLDENGEKVYFGDQFGTAPSDKSLIQRVQEGDPTMHMLAFQRQGKDPVLLVNWRAHPHRSGGKTSYTVDADVIGALREYMHTNTDYQFAYFQGAAGNVNTTSRIPGETYKSGKITEYGNELGRQLVQGLANLKEVETGPVQTSKIIYAAPIDHSEDDRYEEAVELQSIYSTLGPNDNQIAIANQYGFSSFFHASRLILKYGMGQTKDLELNVFSIGQHVAFYTAPGELWDSVSVKMEEDSPFDMTFCIGYSNGNVAYIPYQVTYSSYEYHYCLFTQDDTVTQMMAYYKQLLDEQFQNAN